MSFSKSIFCFLIIILFCFFGISSVFAGNIGTTQACQIAKAKAIAEGRGDDDPTSPNYIETNGRFFCYDETNMVKFLQRIDNNTLDAFVNNATDTSHLTIGAVHTFEPGVRVEFHVCRIDLLDTGKISVPSPATSSHAGIAKIIINTTDGTYLGGTPCLSQGNHFHMAGSIEAKGHSGWVEIETFHYHMNLEGYTATGSIDVSGKDAFCSVGQTIETIDGVNGESKDYSYGGRGGGNYHSPSIHCGKGAYGGGGGCGSRRVGGVGGFGGGCGGNHSAAGSYGGGGGGIIKIQATSSLIINGNLSVNGGIGGTTGSFYHGGGGGGGTIEIQTSGSLTINGNLSANGGNAPCNWSCGGGGGGGTIEIQTDSSLSINGNLSVNGGRSTGGYYNGGGGGGGTIKIITKGETTVSNSLNANGGTGAAWGHNGSIKISTLANASGFPLYLNAPLSAVGNYTTGTIEIKAFSVNTTQPITGAKVMTIESLATSTINGELRNTVEIKLNGFSFEINSPITTVAATSTSIEISSTSSLNILANLTTHNTNAIATAGRIKLNSTSSSIYIGSPTIRPIINAPFGKIELSNGTTTVEPDASITIEKGTLSSSEIYLISGGNINLNTTDAILSANGSPTANAIGRIGIQNCGKLTIKGKILSYSYVNTGAISIYSNEITAFTNSEIKAKNTIYIIFLSSCEGLEEPPGTTCLPLRATLNPTPTIIQDPGATCVLGAPNIPPYKPEKEISPSLGATGVPLCPYLRWQSGDPEGQDVTFQIYLSTVRSEVKNNLFNVKIAEFTTSTNPDGSKLYYKFYLSEARWGLDPTKPVCNLEMDKKYYWKVIVTDIP